MLVFVSNNIPKLLADKNKKNQIEYERVNPNHSSKERNYSI